MTLTYRLSVDMEDNGDYVGANDDITGDVIYIRYNRGRDSDMDVCSPGTMEFELNNNNKKYTPAYSLSPIYGDWAIGKSVKLEIYKDILSPWQTVFTGKIGKIIPSPHKTEQTCHVSCYDSMADLNRITISTEYLDGPYSTYISAYMILFHTGWPISPVGLAAYWPIYVSDYTGYDYSGHGHTLVDAVNFREYDATNPLDQRVLQFDAPAEYTECADLFGIVNDFTYSWWARIDPAVANGDVMWDHGCYFHKAGGVLAFTCSLGTKSLTDDFNDDAWHQFTIVKSSTAGIKIYVDNAIDVEDATWLGDVTAGADVFTMGNSDAHNTGMPCFIDDFRFYARCLTGHEVLELNEIRTNITALSESNSGPSDWDGVKALAAMRDLEELEMNIIYVNGEGKLTYTYRYAGLTSATIATLNNNMTDAVYDMDASRVVNRVISSYADYAEQVESALWTLDHTPMLEPDEEIEIWGNFNNHAYTTYTPVATTDYTANENANGSGADLTADLQVWAGIYGKGCRFTLKNTGASNLYITLLKIRGLERPSTDAISIQTEDTGSFVLNGVLEKSIDGEYHWTLADAQEYCDLYLFLHKSPKSKIAVTIDNEDSGKEQIIYDLQNIGSKVYLVCDELGVDDNYFVNAIEHEISDGGKYHTLKLSLQDAYSWESLWLLGVSLLGTQTYLAP